MTRLPREQEGRRAGHGRLCVGARGGRGPVFGLVAALAFWGLFPGSADGFEWKLTKHRGRDYVTVQSIHEFYRFQNLDVGGKEVRFRSPTLEMRATVGKQDLFINNVRFILSYPVIESGGKVLISRLDLAKLIDPVLRPSYIDTAEMFDTVVVDAGHGGHDSGATGAMGKEKDFALKLAHELRSSLQRRGFKVKMTRSSDRFLTLNERVRYANGVPGSIFVSLHFNSGRSEAKGIETFALSPQGASSTYKSPRSTDARNFSGNRRDSENIALATAIHASVLHKIPSAVDRGIKRARWAVLTGIDRPAVLFEGGFVTNPTEARMVASSSHRRVLAEAIADAVKNYRDALRGR